jgi:hypothetical protein
MTTFNEQLDLFTQLSKLVQETCKFPRDSLERKQGLNKIIFLMQQSGKIWRGGQELNFEHYQEALQENWYFFSRNLCQIDSVAINPYDSKKANVITWFNTYLEYKIRDIQGKANQEIRRQASFKIDQETGDIINPIDLIPAPSQDSVLMIEELIKWLEENQQRLSRIHLRDRTEINSHLLISRRLISEQTWKTISEEFSVPIPTLAKFYNNRCLPLIQEWGKSQGYLDA